MTPSPQTEQSAQQEILFQSNLNNVGRSIIYGFVFLVGAVAGWVLLEVLAQSLLGHPLSIGWGHVVACSLFGAGVVYLFRRLVNWPTKVWITSQKLAWEAPYEKPLIPINQEKRNHNGSIPASDITQIHTTEHQPLVEIMTRGGDQETFAFLSSSMSQMFAQQLSEVSGANLQIQRTRERKPW